MVNRKKPDGTPRRLRLAVFKFASCDGCQLSVLNLEDDLLALGQALDIAYFPEASSGMKPGPYDIVLVEGSITTPDDAARILALREQAATLITIGACATAGGIQALRNWADVESFKRAVYPSPQYIQSLSTSTPISEHVRVDFELWGCPIDKGQLLRVITDLLAGVRPQLSADSVCMECKRRGNVCVMVAKGIPCLGPVTRTGCGAICPTAASVRPRGHGQGRACRLIRRRSRTSFIRGSDSFQSKWCGDFVGSTALWNHSSRRARHGRRRRER